MLFYDYAVTVDLEVKWIWKTRRKGMITYLFFVVSARVIAPVFHLTMKIEQIPPSYHLPVCDLRCEQRYYIVLMLLK